MRTGSDRSKLPENYFPIEEAQIIIAQDAGFGSWEKLMDAIAAGAPPQGSPYALDTEGQPHRTPPPDVGRRLG